MALIASGRERPFTAEEILVSGTDRDERIRLANAAFVRVSGYAAEELAGASLRHPGMPRAVARVVAAADRPVAAYVRRLAQDGAQYWAMALSVPLAGGRLWLAVKPTAPTFATARDTYADVRDVEVSVEDRDPRRRELGIEAGVARLRERFGDFEAWMRAAFVAEAGGREPARAGAGARAEAALALLAGLDGL